MYKQLSDKKKHNFQLNNPQICPVSKAVSCQSLKKPSTKSTIA